MSSFDTMGRWYGFRGSSPTSTISPSKPSSRRRSAERSPATPAPTMTIRSPSLIVVRSFSLDSDGLFRAEPGGGNGLVQTVPVDHPADTELAVRSDLEGGGRLHLAETEDFASLVVDAHASAAPYASEDHCLFSK